MRDGLVPGGGASHWHIGFPAVQRLLIAGQLDTDLGARSRESPGSAHGTDLGGFRTGLSISASRSLEVTSDRRVASFLLRRSGLATRRCEQNADIRWALQLAWARLSKRRTSPLWPRMMAATMGSAPNTSVTKLLDATTATQIRPCSRRAPSITPEAAIPERGVCAVRAKRVDLLGSRGIHPAMLTILLIVLVVLLLTGGIGFGYRGRRRV